MAEAEGRHSYEHVSLTFADQSPGTTDLWFLHRLCPLLSAMLQPPGSVIHDTLLEHRDCF